MPKVITVMHIPNKRQAISWSNPPSKYDFDSSIKKAFRTLYGTQSSNRRYVLYFHRYNDTAENRSAMTFSRKRFVNGMLQFLNAGFAFRFPNPVWINSYQHFDFPQLRFHH